MKIVILAVLVSLSAFAQFPKMPTVDTVKDLSKEVLAACKEDKSKIEG